MTLNASFDKSNTRASRICEEKTILSSCECNSSGCRLIRRNSGIERAEDRSGENNGALLDDLRKEMSSAVEQTVDKTIWIQRNGWPCSESPRSHGED